MFTIYKSRLKEIIEILEEKKILGKVKFLILGRGNCVNEEIIVLLKKLNVKNISFGVETGSRRMLKLLKGNMDLEDNIKAIKLCRKYGIEPDGAFMIGMPYETKEDMEDTYKFIKKYLPKGFFLGQMWAFPNTPIWDYAVKHKLIDENMYESEGRRFLEFDENNSLTLDASKEDLKKYYFKIKSLLQIKRNASSMLKKISTLRPRHIYRMMDIMLLKKVYNLRVDKVKQG